MTREELKDYIVEYVKGALSYVGQVYVRPSHIRQLRPYHTHIIGWSGFLALKNNGKGSPPPGSLK